MQDDRWYVVDLTHARFGALRGLADSRHVHGAPGCLLSLNSNAAGTRGVMKVRGGRQWAVPETGPILRSYGSSEFATVRALVNTPQWREGAQ